MQQLDVGETAIVSTNWWDVNGVPANPATIDLTVTKPSGTTIAKTKGDMTQGATDDVWIYNQLVDERGLWRFDFVGDVAGDTVEQSTLILVDEALAAGPCEPWCTWEEVESCGTIAGATDVPAQRELWMDQASEILWNLTGRFYSGICQQTISLCRACAGCAPAQCTCDPRPSIDLGSSVPTWAVWDVVVDGVTLSPSAYTVRGNRYLVRTDDNVWPSGLNSADPDAFRLTRAFGRRVPKGGRTAAAILANQIAKRCVNDGTCRLPQRVTQVVREGVTFTVLDSMKMIEEGRTGLELVDLWMVSDRRGRAPRARMYHPGARSMRRFSA